MLDILSEKGQESRQEELKALALFRAFSPSVRVIETPKDTPAVIDWLLVDKNDTLIGGVEIKCRNISLEYILEKKWLVTEQKIIDCSNVCGALSIPFYGGLWLIGSETFLMKKIWCPIKGFCTNIEEDRTQTQATINGGMIYRDNMFIPMNDAKIIRA